MKTSSVGVRCQFLHHARLSLLHTTEWCILIGQDGAKYIVIMNNIVDGCSPMVTHMLDEPMAWWSILLLLNVAQYRITQSPHDLDGFSWTRMAFLNHIMIKYWDGARQVQLYSSEESDAVVWWIRGVSILVLVRAYFAAHGSWVPTYFTMEEYKQ